MIQPRLEVKSLSIPDVKLIRPRKFGDSRGFFCETYNARDFAEIGIDFAPIQDNQSLSAEAGVVRGLHFQTPPHAQAKLLRVLSGRLFDAVVDLRRASPTFGQHATVELDNDGWWQLFVPAGFAHGFVTLEPGTEVLYKVDAYYAPDNDLGLYWADPDLGIEWPIDTDGCTLSEKDKNQPAWSDVRNTTPF
ncbi:MAG: dTDP-4-dehydrorhamnose 3,5-epimerase [Pseudomonadota bacterium]